MALPTDSYIDIVIDEEVVDRIGLSSALSDISQISSSCYCGMYNNQMVNPGVYETLIPDAEVVNRKTPLIWDSSSFPITFSAGDGSAYSAPDGQYGGVVWLYYIDGNDGATPPAYCITQSNISDYKVVTEWDAPHYVHYPEDPTALTGDDMLSYRYATWNDAPIQYGVWGTRNGLNFKKLEYWDDNEKTNYVAVKDIYPYQIFTFNGHTYLLAMKYSYQYTTTYNSDSQTNNYNPYNISYDEDDCVAYTVAFAEGTFDNGGVISTNNLPYSISSYSHLFTGYTSDKKFIGEVITQSSTLPGASGRLGLNSYYMFHERDDVYLYTANSGLKFYTDKLYKPIISGGVVTGYTDDMDEESELDDWTGTTDHGIGPTPPTPPPGPGYDDDPWNGVSFSGVGVGGAGAFAKCYYMTSTELANLRSWMNSNNVPEGFDPMAQIIGLSQVPVNLSGDDNTTVQFVNSSAVYDPGVTRVVDSGVSTQVSMGTPKRYSLGSVNITRRMQERGEPYLDYDCQIELYLPLIGMFSLDTQAVMGRTITAEAVLDPISGTLAAYAYVTRDGQNLPIAYGSTTIGVDLPISAQQYSVARAALKQANAQLGTSLLSSTLSLIAAATAGGKGSGTGAKTATGSTNGLAAAGIREAGADYMKASQAGNVFGDFMQWGRTIRQLSYGNNTAIAGSFGGSTAQWSYPFTPYVKIIRPRYEKPRNYNRSQGVPCVQTKKVGSCTGFIQCIGVEVKGITGATDIELQAIQAALTNGVFAGGGS